MADKEVEFTVAGVVEGQHFSVIGRCGDAPIHVGDVFDAVYRYKRRRRPDELGDDPIREVEESASIRVVCIHAYDLSLTTMNPGLTGSLALQGDGLQYLAPGWVLGRKSGPSPTGDHAERATMASA